MLKFWIFCGISGILLIAAENSQICKGNAADRICYPKVFEPTSEFQIVQQDQEIPAGLYVVLDLETGSRKAKLPSEQQKKETSISHTPISTFAKGLSLEEKDSFQDIISRLYNQSEIMPLLLHLENIVHDIDIGIEISSSKALGRLIELLSDSSVEIRAQSALVIGSALSNNPVSVQNSLDSGLVQVLLSKLMLEKDNIVLTKLMFAISQLVRSSVNGVKIFYSNSGIDKMIQLCKSQITLSTKIRLFIRDILDPEMFPEQVVIWTGTKLIELGYWKKENINYWCKNMEIEGLKYLEHTFGSC